MESAPKCLEPELSSNPLQLAASIHSPGVRFADETRFKGSPQDAIARKAMLASHIIHAAHIRAIQGFRRTRKERRGAIYRRGEEQPPLL